MLSRAPGVGGGSIGMLIRGTVALPSASTMSSSTLWAWLISCRVSVSRATR